MSASLSLAEPTADLTSTDTAIDDRLQRLQTALQRWIHIDLSHRFKELGWLATMGAPVPRDSAKQEWDHTHSMAHDAEEYLSCFLDDNTHRTAEELAEIADHLSPGGAHTGGLLAKLIEESAPDADPLLLAAVMWRNWSGGKAGFQFLDDPADQELDEYAYYSTTLLADIDKRTDRNPRRLLTGDDLDFYDSLPDTFSIYRGCSGISRRHAAYGVCWTTSRDVATWFAHRYASRGRKPVLVGAQIRKAEVRLARACEFEIVTIPDRFHALKCPQRAADWRPEMQWRPTAS